MNCVRCDRECQSGEGNPEARLLKRARRGYCADCALTIFLKSTEPLNMLLESQGPEVLRHQGVRLQIAKLLIVGKSDAVIDEINIEMVIQNWKLES